MAAFIVQLVQLYDRSVLVLMAVQQVMQRSLQVSSGLTVNSVNMYVVSCYSGIPYYAPIKSKLQHPPPPGKPRAFDYFLCPGVGNLTGKAFPGVGNLTLPGWGGEN